MSELNEEVFAARDGEALQLNYTQPETGRWFAVQAKSLTMPPGGIIPVCHRNGKLVEQAAIVACEWNRTKNGWQWLNLSPPTKGLLGDMIFDGGGEKDVWYYVVVTDTHIAN